MHHGIMAKKIPAKDRHKGKPKQLFFTDEEMALFRKAAAAEALPSLSSWMKRTLILEARRVVDGIEKRPDRPS